MIGVLFCLIVVLIATLYIKLQPPKELSEIPSLSLWKNIIALIKGESVIQVYKDIEKDVLKEHGIAKFYFFGGWALLISEPEAVKEVFMDSQNFPKMIIGETVKDAIGARFFNKSVATTNGQQWKIQRKIFNPIFKKEFSSQLFKNQIKNLYAIIGSKNGKDIRIDTISRDFTIDALGKAIMDIDFEALINPDNQFFADYQTIVKKVFSPFNFVIPFMGKTTNPLNKSLVEKIDSFRDYFKNVIKEKTEKLEKCNFYMDEPDLLSSMIIAKKTEHAEITESEIIDNCIAFFLAGHDTTATAITASIFTLAKYPDLQEKLRKEIFEVIGEKDDNISSNEDLKKITYLDVFIKEILRCYPPAMRTGFRRSKKELTVKKYIVPKNSIIMIHIYDQHNNEKYFEDCNDFKPERFLNNENYGTVYSPFGNGTRICMGMNFSIIEQKVFLTSILKKYTVKFHPGHEHDTLPVDSNIILHVGSLHIDFVPRY